MNTLLDRPISDPKFLLRDAVAQDLARGRSEDEIYRRRIDTAIRAARLEGCDESDVEVAATQARRDTAEILAECRADGLFPDL